MPALTRVVVAGLLATLCIAVAPPTSTRAQAIEAVPSTLLRDWSWRHLGPFDGADQFVSVLADNAFPYRVCGTATNGRAACGASRSDIGWVSGRTWEWLPFRGATPVAPDPSDADIVYGGAVQRFDRRTTQMQDVTPPAGDEPLSSTGVLLFSPTDPRTLYFGTSVVRRTSNSGLNWTVISPDLSRILPASSTADVAPMDVSISALAASPVDGRVIWAGTTDGALHITRDSGTTWLDVTPSGAVDTAAVARVEASRFDPNTAYVVIAAPDRVAASHAVRTRDGGRTWTDITHGIPDREHVNVIREDPFRRGLLFAGTSRSVAMSVDDGERWQSLALNLRETAVTDLAIKDADVVAATNGRGFWVLDDISPLRQLTADVARADVFLFRPTVAWRERSRAEVSKDAPSDGPAVRSPPAGATFNYLIGPGSTATSTSSTLGAGAITLDIVETVTGDVIRRFSSDGAEPTLAATPGLHRVTWDLRSTPVRGRGVLVQAGTYQVRLSAHGRVARQAIAVRMDPRVRTSTTDLDVQATLSKRVYAKLRELMDARAAAGTSAANVVAFDRASDALVGVLDSLQQSDTRPTPALVALTTAAIDRAGALLAIPQP